MENELIQLANNVNTKLNLYKNLPNTELMDVYKNINFHITPSIFEGTKYFEAMSTDAFQWFLISKQHGNN